MITYFRDPGTEDIFNGISSKKALRFPREIWPVVQRKLDMLNAAYELKDLMAPPGNRLEKLKGELKEFYSIRANDQFRILFKWTGNNATDVELTDYH
ncbi:MAG: type II toxin-antitoxin system RelE/ParE family toxin [Candidatus Omnitrophica bacterium]|nr:type II toxin-antitoxin system RelE/ParE family toxin [Candidatus Omnitrophota bacterium]